MLSIYGVPHFTFVGLSIWEQTHSTIVCCLKNLWCVCTHWLMFAVIWFYVVNERADTRAHTNRDASRAYALHRIMRLCKRVCASKKYDTHTQIKWAFDDFVCCARSSMSLSSQCHPKHTFRLNEHHTIWDVCLLSFFLSCDKTETEINGREQKNTHRHNLSTIENRKMRYATQLWIIFLCSERDEKKSPECIHHLMVSSSIFQVPAHALSHLHRYDQFQMT